MSQRCNRSGRELSDRRGQRGGQERTRERDRRRRARGAASLAIIACGLALVRGQPLLAAAALAAGAAGFRWLRPIRVIRLHEFSLVADFGYWAYRSTPENVDYAWIEQFTWDGDRLNLWMSNPDRGNWALGVVVRPENHIFVTRLLRERRGKTRAELARVPGSDSKPRT